MCKRNAYDEFTGTHHGHQDNISNFAELMESVVL